MALPIDEGAPTLTSTADSASETRFTPANMATASRVWLRGTGTPEDDLEYYWVDPADVHNNAGGGGDGRFFLDRILSAGERTQNLHMLNSLSYHDTPLNRCLLDLLLHQAHVGCGVLRMLPVLDGTPTQWTRSSGADAKYTYVDEYPEDVSQADYLESVAVDNAQRLWFPGLPINGTIMQEVLVYAWVSMRRGTDTGMNIEIKLYNDGSIQTSRTQRVDPPINDTPYLATAKFEGVNETVGWSAGGIVELIARRGAAGGTPNPRWRVYSVAGVGYFEVNDPVVLNVGSFTAHDATYAGLLLEFSVWDGSFRSLALDILKHAPEAFLYVAWDGALTFGRMKAYSDVPSPLDLTPTIRRFRRGVYQYTERTANHVQVRYGVRVPQGTSPSAAVAGNPQPDPVNSYPAQGSKRLRRSSEWTLRRGLVKYRPLDRRLIAGGTSADEDASDCGIAYLNLWQNDVDAIEIACDMRAAEAENGDVVLVDRPDFGLADRTLCVVEKTLDLDNDEVLLTLYDAEYTI